MILFREVFTSKRKTTIMVLIQLLNFLIYWAIFIRELTLQSIIDMHKVCSSFIFLEVEASKVMLLQEKVKKEIRHLLHLIKGGLGGLAVFRVCYIIMPGSMVLIFLYHTSGALL